MVPVPPKMVKVSWRCGYMKCTVQGGFECHKYKFLCSENKLFKMARRWGLRDTGGTARYQPDPDLKNTCWSSVRRRGWKLVHSKSAKKDSLSSRFWRYPASPSGQPVYVKYCCLWRLESFAVYRFLLVSFSSLRSSTCETNERRGD